MNITYRVDELSRFTKAFNTHLDECYQCSHVFNLCHIGHVLLNAAGGNTAYNAEAKKICEKSLMDATQNLLAAIHRDGGQYTQEHGIFRSARDAEQVVVKLMQEKDELLTALKRIVYDDNRLLVRGNQGYPEWREAVSLIQKLEGKDLKFVEKDHPVKMTIEPVEKGAQ